SSAWSIDADQAARMNPANPGDASLARSVAVLRERGTEVLAHTDGELTPTALEEDSLAAAIDRLLTALTEETGIRTELKADPGLPAVSTTTEVALLRAAQSALANVRQHADAGTVVVSLSAAASSLRLDIVDDGVGFDPGQLPAAGARLGGGYGLRAMRARLRELGGGLEVESESGHGTAVAVHVPLAARTQVAQ
ncbi:MAG: sensor histidine kinase, partial [Propionibacteriaceae bacterium]